MKEHADIVVIGSSNTDMVIRTKKMPAPGETVLGDAFLMNPGGKGANQAVAAARLGGKVAFVGCIGNDVFGEQTLKGLLQEGMDLTHLRQDADTPSGIATITVDDMGQNSIVVAAGANAKLGILDIDSAIDVIESSQVVLLQLETNLDTVGYAVKIGVRMGKKVILNPAPFIPLPDEIYKGLFLITPNETEAAGLTGIEIDNEDTAIKAARILLGKGVQNVIITMGKMGAFVLCHNFTGMIQGENVIAVDSTAAGDTFNGALAVALSKRMDIPEAVKFANRAAAFSVTKMGAQQSCPTLEDLK